MKRIILAVCLFAAAGPVSAQTPDSARGDRQAQLQRQLRDRLATMVRTRLQLTDEQARQLQETDSRFEPERRALVQREQRLRMELRTEMLAARPGSTTAVNQDRVSALIDQLLAAQRERFLLVEREQRDLARFLTPVQRAQYMALQQDLRQRVESMRQQGPRRGQQRPPMRARPRP